MLLILLLWYGQRRGWSSACKGTVWTLFFIQFSVSHFWIYSCLFYVLASKNFVHIFLVISLSVNRPFAFLMTMYYNSFRMSYCAGHTHACAFTDRKSLLSIQTEIRDFFSCFLHSFWCTIFPILFLSLFLLFPRVLGSLSYFESLTNLFFIFRSSHLLSGLRH